MNQWLFLVLKTFSVSCEKVEFWSRTSLWDRKHSISISQDCVPHLLWFVAPQGVQGGNITIKVLCDVMSDPSLGDAYARYAAVARLLMDTFSLKCLDASFSNYLRDMTNTSWEGPSANGGGWEGLFSLCCYIWNHLWLFYLLLWFLVFFCCQT